MVQYGLLVSEMRSRQRRHKSKGLVVVNDDDGGPLLVFRTAAHTTTTVRLSCVGALPRTPHECVRAAICVYRGVVQVLFVCPAIR